MNERKQHVIKMAHQLFIDKGFQLTSIQDILDYSGISKGTFYNYFSSKNELLVAIFKTIFTQIDYDQNELLIGQNPADIEIFIKQIELQMKTNRKNKLLALFEEVMVSNDEDLKQFIKRGQLITIRWLYRRFIDIFGESKKPYLLDCAIMFMGILQNNIKFYYMVHESSESINQVVRYSLERIVKMVDEVAKSGDQLIHPDVLEKWLPDCKNADQAFQQDLYHSVLELKKALNRCEEQAKYIELLDFVLDELLHAKNPRKFLVESAIVPFKAEQKYFRKKELQKLEQLIAAYFLQIEQI
jgi:AcrR family transcriptional regulator